jgi:hypothetical protein
VQYIELVRPKSETVLKSNSILVTLSVFWLLIEDDSYVRDNVMIIVMKCLDPEESFIT